MREVSSKATSMILQALDDAGIAVEPLVDGLPVTLAELRDPRGRIHWHIFTEVLARLEPLCGDVFPPEEIGARILTVPSFEFLRRTGQLAVSPRHLYEVARRLVAPALFPHLVVRYDWLASGRLVVTGELLPGYAESKTFFRLCHGNIAALPRLLDLPSSIIEEQAISGRRGRLVLLPPASHTLAARLGRGARGLRGLRAALRGVAQQQSEIEASIEVLRTSRHELQRLLERLPDGVLIQRDGVVRWANAALIEILGAQQLEEVVGRRILDFVPPADRERLALEIRQAATNEVNDQRLEYSVARPDGTVRRVQAGTAQVVDFAGEPARLVVLRDVTEYHRLREQTAISDRLASLGALGAGVAHEINNPLAYVRLSLDIALREAAAVAGGAPPAELHASLARAREGTDRVLGIVRDMKMLSRVHDDPCEAIDLESLLDATLTLAGRSIATKAQLVRSYGPSPKALATRGKLGQVFLNLLTNAADAIPEGAASAHVIRVTTRTEATGRAVVEITDSGCGISPDVAPRVFDPFFTTKPVGAGTGLGLAMCHRIVTELGGTIEVESAPGVTTFRVTLPAANVTPPETAPSEARDVVPDSRARRRVLVVDDEPRLLLSIQRMLADVHDVVTASDGQQVLHILGKDQLFDAVVTDLMMANLSGMDLYAAVREAHPGLERRFVFMTGGAFTRRAQEFLGSVPNRFIQKPFEVAELVGAIDALCSAHADPPPRSGRE